MRSRSSLFAVAAALVVVGRGHGQDPQPTPSPSPAAKRKVAARVKGPPESEQAIEAGLRWLAAHQGAEGRFGAMRFNERCKGPACKGTGLAEVDVGVTGLAVLAFLRAGFDPDDKTKLARPGGGGDPIAAGDVVRKGLDWLVSQQNADGSIGPVNELMIYNHAAAALALIEAYERTRADALREPCQRAARYVECAQNPGAGWRYRPKSGQSDTSVTCWCAAVLRAAKRAGLEVGDDWPKGVASWLDKITLLDGVVGYERPGYFEVVVPGKNDKWANHATMIAAGLLLRPSASADDKRTPVVAMGVRRLLLDVPKWDLGAPRPTIDFYYWYHGTLALYRNDGPSGPNWKTWNKALLEAIRPNQRPKKEGCLAGSWDAVDVDRWGWAGGRVYSTALSVLTLLASASGEGVELAKPDAKKTEPPAEVSPRTRELEKAFLARIRAWLDARKALLCRTCKATGRLYCAKCDGSGSITIEVGQGKARHNEIIRCSGCNGTGTVKCERCEGGIVKSRSADCDVTFGFGSASPIVEYSEKSIITNVGIEEDKAYVMCDVRYLGTDKLTIEGTYWEANGGKWKYVKPKK